MTVLTHLAKGKPDAVYVDNHICIADLLYLDSM